MQTTRHPTLGSRRTGRQRLQEYQRYMNTDEEFMGSYPRSPGHRRPTKANRLHPRVDGGLVVVIEGYKIITLVCLNPGGLKPKTGKDPIAPAAGFDSLQVGGPRRSKTLALSTDCWHSLRPWAVGHPMCCHVGPGMD